MSNPDFAIADVLPGKLNSLVKKLMEQMGVTDANEAVRRVNSGEWIVSEAERKILSGPTIFTFPAVLAAGQVKPQKFYQTGEGLWVSDGFKEFILPGAEAYGPDLPETKAAYFDLAESADDADIQSALPEDHIFHQNEFLARLPGMLERQAGETTDGALLTNGYANIAYVRGISGDVFAVGVYWRSDCREWSLDAGQLRGSRWGAGRRILSRNCPSAA